MAHYDAYTGEIDELSKPDQFSYEVSSVDSVCVCVCVCVCVFSCVSVCVCVPVIDDLSRFSFFRQAYSKVLTRYVSG